MSVDFKNEESLDQYFQFLDYLSESGRNGIEPIGSAGAKVLHELLKRGHERFVVNGKLVFESQMKSIVNTGGTEHEGEKFNLKFNGQRLFIKSFNKNSIKSDAFAADMVHVKVMHGLGLGINSDLVLVNGVYYLIMEKLSGINIKRRLETKKH